MPQSLIAVLRGCAEKGIDVSINGMSWYPHGYVWNVYQGIEHVGTSVPLPDLASFIRREVLDTPAKKAKTAGKK